MTKFISISDGNEIKIGDEIIIVNVYKNSVGGITKIYKNSPPNDHRPFRSLAYTRK